MYFTAKSVYFSPIGAIEIATTSKGICSIEFVDAENAESVNPYHPILATCIQQLQEYFEGDRTDFDVPLDVNGTNFQCKVWEELLKIPFGKTIAYQEIANKLNDSKAARAVGSACGRNKIWLLIPCHRVVASNGALTGYAGGINRKKWLLEYEKQQVYGKQAQLFD